MSEGRPRAGKWKLLRDALTALSDDDIADDESDALPAAGTRISVPFHDLGGMGKCWAIEFIVVGYVAATGVVADNDADTFSVDATLLIDLADIRLASGGAKGSSAIGAGATGRARSGNVAADARKIAVAQVSTAGHRYFRIYRVPVHGADELILRLHSSTGAPGAADRYSVLYREVLE